MTSQALALGAEPSIPGRIRVHSRTGAPETGGLSIIPFADKAAARIIFRVFVEMTVIPRAILMFVKVHAISFTEAAARFPLMPVAENERLAGDPLPIAYVRFVGKPEIRRFVPAIPHKVINKRIFLRRGQRGKVPPQHFAKCSRFHPSVDPFVDSVLMPRAVRRYINRRFGRCSVVSQLLCAKPFGNRVNQIGGIVKTAQRFEEGVCLIRFSDCPKKQRPLEVFFLPNVFAQLRNAFPAIAIG